MKTISTAALICVGAFAIVAALFLFSIRDRRSQIYFAVENGDTNSIAEYLGSGHDVNKPILSYPFGGGRNVPLLDIAIQNGHASAVDFLLAKGANPNELDYEGKSPVFCSVGFSRNGVSMAVRTQILNTLLKTGANPNLKCTHLEGWTPLMEAAELGEPEMAHLLLLNGANVNATNAAGQTALLLAHDPEVANVLTKAGAR